MVGPGTGLLLLTFPSTIFRLSSVDSDYIYRILRFLKNHRLVKRVEVMLKIVYTNNPWRSPRILEMISVRVMCAAAK
ncbi:unnamed protein product [Allacma fusca]|uniref:Uncharacterized protein n=1 Tax=Allacma fusca TaxID=39272 RepID=A0A8J2L010_9HEXA|nr:unnamed protein product [Allacma fusca]